jgi:hypothetical protein
MQYPIPANSHKTLRKALPPPNSAAPGVTRLSLSETRESLLPKQRSSGRHQAPPKAPSVLASMASQSAARSSPRISARARTVTGTRYDAFGRPR